MLGPGSIHVAHTPFEKIAKKELLAAVDLYFELAQRLAGMTSDSPARKTFGWVTRLEIWIAGCRSRLVCRLDDQLSL